MAQLETHDRGTPDAGVVPDVVELSASTLPLLARRMRVPTYDRSGLTPSVVHFSVGGFHRAHQLVYLDDLAEQGNTDWGVVGVGLHSPAMRDALQPQDHLYTVVERGADGERARVIGSMIDYHFAPDSPETVLDVLVDERTRLVTMTVTGNAYRIDATSGEFAPDGAALADLADPRRPQSLFGYIVEALDRRRRAGARPFTVLSCDNMQQNGEAARTAVVGFARLRDEVLARWIDDNVAFPGSMVDRITPSTSEADRDRIAATFGVGDRWPVITEQFSQWVMEDAFCNDRPPLEQVGVQFVPDVGDHELMKTRLLNASHSAMGHLGQLAGVEQVAEFLADPVFGRYVTRLMAEEIAPLLPAPAGVDLAGYQRNLLQRFADPSIGDRLDRLCRRGSSKVPLYLLPSLVQARAEGRPSTLLTVAVAGFCRYLQGSDPAGHELVMADDRAAELGMLARAGGTDPRPLLAVRSVFDDLGDDPAAVDAVAEVLRQFEEHGVRATVAAAVDQDGAVRHDALSPLSVRRSGDAARRARAGLTAPARATAVVASGDRLLPA